MGCPDGDFHIFPFTCSSGTKRFVTSG
uniref:Cytochrome b6/f complex subunit VIII n=1 Tax=Drynaria acuminata TaxID=2784197 RepID=A0A872YNW1_9MONI|nr:cytochrome b6/f complex subunit VIII [Drynaria acuminata]QOY24923.1 cytochrome b6/f complex subunit VIII [Drynaria acuminata]